MAQVTLTGRCLCGTVKYEVTGEPARFLHCHCARCRKATGTDSVLVPAGSLDVEPPIKPQARIFTAWRSSWSCVGDGLEAFPEFPSR
jgi:hypothetical protein